MQRMATIGRVEIELHPEHPDAVRLDVASCGSTKGCWPDYDGYSMGGGVYLRVRSHVLHVALWTELAHDVAAAVSAAVWRRLERRDGALGWQCVGEYEDPSCGWEGLTPGNGARCPVCGCPVRRVEEPSSDTIPF